jgi:hypothetical protein
LLNLGNYLLLQEDELYIAAYLGSLKMALISTLLCLLIGYPMAYAISQGQQGDPDRSAAADHDADLDRDPDPRLRLDGHPQQQRPAQQRPAGHR